jgi:DNA-binding response OmpR family regulator
VIADQHATLGPEFDAMADEWLRRPWVLSDALARVQLALARRALVIATQHVIAGEFVLDVGERRARYAGHALDLTALEFDLLVALARSVGSAVPRDQLRGIVSSRRPAGSDRALDVHVCHLRAKLREASVGDNPIHTVRGIGYALVPASRRRSRSRG